MTNDQKDLTSPTKTDANQNKDGQNNTANHKKEDGTMKPTEATEKNKPVMNEDEKERKDSDHPHKTSEPIAEKEQKSSK